MHNQAGCNICSRRMNKLNDRSDILHLNVCHIATSRT